MADEGRRRAVWLALYAETPGHNNRECCGTSNGRTHLQMRRRFTDAGQHPANACSNRAATFKLDESLTIYVHMPTVSAGKSKVINRPATQVVVKRSPEKCLTPIYASQPLSWYRMCLYASKFLSGRMKHRKPRHGRKYLQSRATRRHLSSKSHGSIQFVTKVSDIEK